eukprot:jgi/Botrbrau1/20927/Bobra.0135s0058.1
MSASNRRQNVDPETLSAFLSECSKVILGSASFGRREIMDQIAKEYAFKYRQMQADIDEQAVGDRSSHPETLVTLLAQAKADALKARLPESSGVLITCDQVVVCNGRILEKPADPDEARHFIESYSVFPASTVSSVLVTDLQTGKSRGGVDVTKIFFDPIPADVVEQLLQDGSVYKCAGGLMIEHPLVAPLVRSLEGTIDSVQGLPRHLLLRLIAELRS